MPLFSLDSLIKIQMRKQFSRNENTPKDKRRMKQIAARIDRTDQRINQRTRRKFAHVRFFCRSYAYLWRVSS